MLKRLYLSMLLLVACNSISAMEEVKQQITVPTRKKLEIIRPSQQRITQEDGFSSTTAVTPIIPQTISQSVADEIPRVVAVATHDIRQNQHVREYIAIDKTLVARHTGDNVEYYSEYHARSDGDTSIVSFPLNCCDPLPIRNFGSIRYFFPSAIEFGSHSCLAASPLKGVSEPMRVVDLDINRIIVVRAKNRTIVHGEVFSRSEVYIGYNSNSGVSTRRGLIYHGKILFIQTKYIPNPFMAPSFLNFQRIPVAGVEHFTRMDMMRVSGSNDFSAFIGPLEPGICYRDGFLYSHVCYWSKDENKLKGIHYRPH